MSPLSRIRWWLGKSQHRSGTPCNLVQLCRRSQELRSIINEALQGHSPWPSDLIERVEEFVLEKGNRELSVYEVATIDPLDHGHALGVIAEGISQDDFHTNAKKRKRGSTRGTLLLPEASLPRNVHLQFTPENNLNFFPANDRHYDLCVPDAQELAEAILDGIHKGKVGWTFLANQDGTYRLQAAVAYSHCLAEFGKLDHTNPPSEWGSGTSLSSSEQIEILKHLTDTSAVDSPVMPS